MCWPELVGSVEVEERRPRTWNEPRRKRLNFVRSHQRDSDEWVSPAHPRRLTEQEIWERHRTREMEQERLMHPVAHHQLQGHHDPRMVQIPPAPPQWHHPIQPGYHGHQLGFDQHGHQAHQPQLDRRSYHSDDDGGIETLGHDDQDGHDDHPLTPRFIPIKPPNSQLPKGLKAHAKKSGHHKKRYSISSSASDNSSSADSFAQFSEGFGAGRRSLSKRPVQRGRSRSRFTDDSFEDLMEPRSRSRSRRGRR